MMSDVDNERHYARLGAVGIRKIYISSSWKPTTALINEQLIHTKRNKNRKLCGRNKENPGTCSSPMSKDLIR